MTKNINGKCECSCEYCGADCEPFWNKQESKQDNKKQKEIIIDKVNVSECAFLDKSAELNICCYKDVRTDKNRFVTYCINNKNCYYKQLKRKTQECEELKKKKEENEKFYLTKYANKDSYCLELEHELNKYKQTLDEIERFMIYEFSGQNQWVKKNVLDIINKAKKGGE